jgi:hypothetical protein
MDSGTEDHGPAVYVAIVHVSCHGYREQPKQPVLVPVVEHDADALQASMAFSDAKTAWQVPPVPRSDTDMTATGALGGSSPT